MNEQPALLVLMITIGAYVFWGWCQDYRAAQIGQPQPQALPGATPASLKTCLIAAAGALVILGLETWGEHQLGLSEQQSKITVLFGAYTLIAAFIEELIFRGFIVIVVIENKGKLMLWSGIVGASIVFAVLHPFLWKWDMAEASGWHALAFWRWPEWFEWQLTPKGWFSTITVFVSSLWFYTLRFALFNFNRSLLPCISAHITKNFGVLVIKAFQGFIVGWW
jgi:membrane protease YdiL (CAAX protease family)